MSKDRKSDDKESKPPLHTFLIDGEPMRLIKVREGDATALANRYLGDIAIAKSHIKFLERHAARVKTLNVDLLSYSPAQVSAALEKASAGTTLSQHELTQAILTVWLVENDYLAKPRTTRQPRQNPTE